MLLPDISEFQPNADLAGIKKQNGGAVIMRVGYGADHKDLSFTNHRAQAHTAGFSFVGLYHYIRADQDPTAQARQFCNWVGHLVPNEIPIIDLEQGDGSQLSRANKWLSFVDDNYDLDRLPLNRRSWLYTGENYGQTHDLASICASIRHTWVAKYSVDPPSLPHSLWQSTNGAQGVNKTNWAGAGYCDTNVTGYTLAQLSSMTHQ